MPLRSPADFLRSSLTKRTRSSLLSAFNVTLPAVLLQTYSTSTEGIVLTDLPAAPFYCHEDPLVMSCEKLEDVRTVNEKLPREDHWVGDDNEDIKVAIAGIPDAEIRRRIEVLVAGPETSTILMDDDASIRWIPVPSGGNSCGTRKAAAAEAHLVGTETTQRRRSNGGYLPHSGMKHEEQVTGQGLFGYGLTCGTNKVFSWLGRYGFLLILFFFPDRLTRIGSDLFSETTNVKTASNASANTPTKV
ncbi:hypothetical protein EDD16DRAFT_1521039 [Pisolithus croceorrhizus]|nr:hypothetical protein EV401DRAFT_1892754 [Pisolithus croceorrhizus]KAI6114618.1 hypothetical protein EDD16DRAFT_1521039 [Pisolithus croceorrhizus]